MKYRILHNRSVGGLSAASGEVTADQIAAEVGPGRVEALVSAGFLRPVGPGDDSDDPKALRAASAEMIGEREGRIGELQKELEAAKGRANNLASERDSLRRQLDEARAELEKARNRAAAATPAEAEDDPDDKGGIFDKRDRKGR